MTRQRPRYFKIDLGRKLGLAASAGDRGLGPQSAERAAAEAAGRARDAWRRVAGAVDHVSTDTWGQVSWVAIEARDLAMWTGRLAYAEPGWTPVSGPRRPVRAPESLAPGPEQVALVVAAVHHANHTLTRLAKAQHEEIRAAAQAGRILVTTRSLPDDFDIPRPFARAPQERVSRLLSHYRDTAQACGQATVAVADVAEATRAPSRVLTVATAAVEADRDRDGGSCNALTGRAEAGVGRETPDLMGPVGRTLRDLGVTSPDLLRRGTELDRASERLIIEAVGEHGPRNQTPDAVALNRSKGSAALINHALASGDPGTVALLWRAEPSQREPPEPEP